MTQKLTVLNGKEVMYAIIDGEQKTPEEIARIRGLLGAKDTDIRDVIHKVMEKEFVTVNKIKNTKARGPIMFLVGQVMKQLNRHGDP
jgi:Asp-tRNA(Asn)/Glu-tRNA(Gln) amidotransferase B subunit